MERRPAARGEREREGRRDKVKRGTRRVSWKVVFRLSQVRAGVALEAEAERRVDAAVAVAAAAAAAAASCRGREGSWRADL